ncbi:hypothetical protein WKW50_16310 [Ochrobactrum sp. GPK 3]
MPKLINKSLFQNMVHGWAVMTFGPEVANDITERCDRYVEESMELVQAIGYDRQRAHDLVDYVFDRPVGEVPQEVGGVMVTLAALCSVVDCHPDKLGWVEYNRINDPEIVERIREKQRTKPTGSALPGVAK